MSVAARVGLTSVLYLAPQIAIADEVLVDDALQGATVGEIRGAGVFDNGGG